MIKITAVLLTILVINIGGCQQQEAKIEAKQESSVERIVPVAPIAKLPCKKSMSPPVKDKTKIKNMLEKSGQITQDMSPQQVEKVVKNYIRKKNAAFKDCQRKG